MPYKDGNGWRAVVKVQGVRRQRKFRRKKDAAAWEREQRKWLNRSVIHTDLLCLCTKYLKHAEKYQPKVFAEKKNVNKRIIAHFGPDMIVADITPEMAEEYLRIQKEYRSANASNKDRKNLCAMFNKGIKTFGIQNNPFADTEKFAHDRKPQYTPPAEDVLALIMAATRKERVFLDCYLQTGARRSEIFRLLWSDVNFDRQTIRLGSRKTRDGSMVWRTLTMSQELKASLKWWWENRTFRRSPFVFVDDQKGPHYGKPYKERRRFMRGLCKRAGIQEFGFHALRRFVASMLDDSGKVGLKSIQKVLGHAKPSTTDLYLSQIRSDGKETMELLSTALLVPVEEEKKEDAT
jgi:integrase